MKTDKKRGRPAGQSRSEIQLVGYLTRAELQRQLNALVAGGKIGHWWAVQHPADEDCGKTHFHIRMTPPISRAVVWADIIEQVAEMVPGEALPRRLVADKRAVNDMRLDGLLYARHDRRYCGIKNERKATYDYPREAFMTDCPEWFDALWTESDNYTPAPKRYTVEEVLTLLERNPELSDRDLLRTCLVNGINKGQFDMLKEYRLMLRRDGGRRAFDKSRVEERDAFASDPEQLNLDLDEDFRVDLDQD